MRLLDGGEAVGFVEFPFAFALRSHLLTKGGGTALLFWVKTQSLVARAARTLAESRGRDQFLFVEPRVGNDRSLTSVLHSRRIRPAQVRKELRRARRARRRKSTIF